MPEDRHSEGVSQLAETIAALLERLAIITRNDPTMKELLGRFGRSLLLLAEDARREPGSDRDASSAALSAPTADAGEAMRHTHAAETAQPQIAKRLEPLPPLTLSTSILDSASAPAERASSASRPMAEPDELMTVEKRCRLKAEGCRLAVERMRLMAMGVDFRTEIQPRYDELIARARMIPNCFLWMCHSSAPMASKTGAYEELGDCYDVCADAASLLRTACEDDAREEGFLEKALDLAAEAQSMLRAMLGSLDARKDMDQDALFHWLKQRAYQEQILIRRFMRLDDVADPTALKALQERVEMLDAELSQQRERVKQYRSGIKQVGYHLKIIRQKPGHDHDHDWQKIAATITELVGAGMQPSNVELRDLLLPFADDMPGGIAERDAVKRVLMEIDRYEASRPATTETTARESVSPAIAEVAELLTGRSILMIGGEMRPHAKKALEESFGLHELIWMKTREHNTRIDFEPDVARPEVALVLLAIRWCRHSYEDVKLPCEKHGKPLVRLPAGYSPNQVAEQILKQCSQQLRESRYAFS